MRLFLSVMLGMALLADPVSAQLFRRGVVRQQPIVQNCPGGACPIVQGTPIPPSVVVRAPVSTAAEVAAVVADTPHVRCIAGNSCGSGTICGSDGDGSYVVTNAHVAGTTLGRVVNVDVVANGQGVKTSGRVVMAGYSDSRMVDFCIIFVEGLSSKRYMPMLKTEPDSPPFATTGSPRCVWPQVKKDFGDARNYGDGLITGLPNAIGGQSGSAICNSEGHQIALLTWSMSGRCAGQKTSKLWAVATTRNVQLADPRPEGLRELAEPGSDRPETAEGVFGDCKLFEAATGVRPVTDNIIANVVGSAMEDLPIWYAPGKPDPTPEPEPDCPPCPPCPDCPDAEQPDGPDCVVLNGTEKALIDAIRAQEARFGDGEKAMDWMKLIQLIMELMKLIQESR